MYDSRCSTSTGFLYLCIQFQSKAKVFVSMQEIHCIAVTIYVYIAATFCSTVVVTYIRRGRTPLTAPGQLRL